MRWPKGILFDVDGTLVDSEPLHQQTIRNFFEFQQEKNNVLILSGNDSHLANEVEARLRELYAVEKIHARLKPGDTLYEEARDKLEELSERFTKAVSGAYNRLFFPGGNGELVMATIDGMSLQVSLDPAAVDCDRVFALLDLLVNEVLDGRLRTGGLLSPPDVE